MRPDKQTASRSVNTGNMDPQMDNNILKSTRRRLQDRFESHCQYSVPSNHKSNIEKGWNSFNLPNVSVPRLHPTRVLRSGANTLSRTLNSVQTTFGTLSQKFRRSTRRRYRFKNESPCSPVTPQTRSRHILGRTPTKLYSPFGIESPCKKSRGKENDVETGHHTPKLRSVRKNYAAPVPPEKSSCQSRPQCLYGKRCQFSYEVEEARIGVWEFGQVASSIVRRTVHH